MVLDLIGPCSLEVRDLTEPTLHVHGDAGGEGFGAMQMFVASLALCSASVLQEYARGPLGADTRGLKLALRWDYGEKPYRIARIESIVSWPEVPASRRDAVVRAIATCTIHRSLDRPPDLVTRFAPDTVDHHPPPVSLESVPPRAATEAGLPVSERPPASPMKRGGAANT
jgi:uncharacterized OsmC-like protein